MITIKDIQRERMMVQIIDERGGIIEALVAENEKLKKLNTGLEIQLKEARDGNNNSH